MKKLSMCLRLVLLGVILYACDTETEKKNGAEEGKTEIQIVETEDNMLTTETEERESVTSADKTEEVVSEENTLGTETSQQESVQTDGTTEEITEEATSQENYPGADVVEVVNLRGDKATVYKLADGTYMDRIERRFTYNGTDTWTDEDGVEWNEVVK